MERVMQVSEHVAHECAGMTANLVSLASTTAILGARSEIEESIQILLGELAAVVLYEALNGVAPAKCEDIYESKAFQAMRTAFKKLADDKHGAEYRGKAMESLRPILKKLAR